MSLALRAVAYRYAGTSRPALDGIDLELQPGSVLGVTGPNGAGKSTLCLVAAGLAPATIGGQLDGSVEVDGIGTAFARPDELAQRCGILFQNPATQMSGTSPTVWEEVAFGPRNLGLPLNDVVERVASALGALAIEALAPRDPERLSGGQSQLVALAGVLALRPAYLLLDEPTSQLDPLGTRLVGEAIGQLVSRTGAGVLLVEHRTDLLRRIADRVVVLVDGALAAGPDASVLDDERLLAWGIEPPSELRLSRAAAAARVRLPRDDDR
jgi:energy-coupling factor transporter ATP-binding protein EcfA2